MGLKIGTLLLATLLLSSVVGCGCTSNSNPSAANSGGTTTDNGGTAGDNGAIAGGSGAKPALEPDVPKLAAAKFSNPTAVNNEWYPLKPGTRLIWDGTAVDEEGDEETHSVSFTVTDLTKEIDGVRAVVCWDRDFVDGELEEREIVFFAQDDDGNVWLLGEYPEELSNGDIEATPGWLHGMKDGKAGIYMPANPKLGDADFPQGWAPSVPWTDRAKVHETGAKVSVPTGDFDDVLVFDEWNAEEPDARHMKYYARRVGIVKIGFRGNDKTQEDMALVKIETLNEEEMAAARKQVLEMDKRANEHCAEIFAKTKPIEPASGGR